MKRLTVLMLCLGCCASAHALNYQFLRHSPASTFTDGDWEIAIATAREALDDAADGDSRAWTNPDTGHQGSYRVDAAPTGSPEGCRKLVIHHRTGQASATTEYVVCPQEDGWRFLR